MSQTIGKMRTALAAALFLTLLVAQSLLAQRPRIQFKEEVFDFGNLQKGEVVSHIFEFVNAGDAPLHLFDTWGD